MNWVKSQFDNRRSVDYCKFLAGLVTVVGFRTLWHLGRRFERDSLEGEQSWAENKGVLWLAKTYML